MGMHGGDRYRNQVRLDFSVNVNPLGTPDSVEEALHRAAASCGWYPDIEAERLKRAVSGMLGVPEEQLLFGNGASELFMAAVHALQPRKTVLPVPSFYGYEYAAKAAGSELLFYRTKRENGFRIEEELDGLLTEDVDLLFLANPNNPTGRLADPAMLEGILRHCGERGIYVVLDECFIEFCGEGRSLISEAERFGSLIVVRAFTKIFAVPGVRLGYAVCGNPALREKIARQLPEWNLSCFAQEAGCACAELSGFILQTQAYVEREREFLAEGLERRGFSVFPSDANFLLLYSRDAFLYERLLEKGILIRDCGNFRGLEKGFYRIAVRSRAENEILLAAL